MRRRPKTRRPEEPLLETPPPSSRALWGRWVGVLAALLVLICVLAVALNRSQAPPDAAVSAVTEANPPDAVIEKFHLISTVHGLKRWELYSTTAKVFQEAKKAYADGIFAQYYKEGRLVSTLTADQAVIDTETNATQAQGHVELVVENGSKLEAEDLDWDPGTDEIRTQGRVHVYKGMDDITAVGLVADTQLNNVNFLSDVQTKVRDTKEIENFEKKKKF